MYEMLVRVVYTLVRPRRMAGHDCPGATAGSGDFVRSETPLVDARMGRV